MCLSVTGLVPTDCGSSPWSVVIDALITGPFGGCTTFKGVVVTPSRVRQPSEMSAVIELRSTMAAYKWSQHHEDNRITHNETQASICIVSICSSSSEDVEERKHHGQCVHEGFRLQTEAARSWLQRRTSAGMSNSSAAGDENRSLLTWDIADLTIYTSPMTAASSQAKSFARRTSPSRYAHAPFRRLSANTPRYTERRPGSVTLTSIIKPSVNAQGRMAPQVTARHH